MIPQANSYVQFSQITWKWLCYRENNIIIYVKPYKSVPLSNLSNFRNLQKNTRTSRLMCGLLPSCLFVVRLGAKMVLLFDSDLSQYGITFLVIHTLTVFYYEQICVLMPFQWG